MKELTNEKLHEVNGGGAWVLIGLGAAVVFLIGVFDGYVRPFACRK